MKITILGGSGLIGMQLIKQACADHYFTKINVIVRRPLAFQDPKINELVINFDDLSSVIKGTIGDALICTLGTTKKKTPDKKCYREVDLTYTLISAKGALENGHKQVHLVSSIGANEKSSVFYPALKGEKMNVINEQIERLIIFELDLFKLKNITIFTKLKNITIFTKSKIIIMKGLSKIILSTLLIFTVLSCNKNNGVQEGTATLKLTINGQQESFDMSDPDVNSINNGNCNGSSIVDYMSLGDFENGTFDFWAGNATLTNNTYSCVQNAQNFCASPHIEIYVMGTLDNRLEDIYNVPIFRLEPSSNTTIEISELGQGKVSVSWSGNLNVLDFGGNIIGVIPATFNADKVSVDDFR